MNKKRNMENQPMNNDTTPSYFKYWGKASKDGVSYHLLVYHCLDVAAVGWILMDPSKPLCKNLAKTLDVDPTWLRDFFVFCLILHDIGKFSRSFQGLKPNLSPDLVKPNSRMLYSERHDSLGFCLWREIVANMAEPSILSNFNWLSNIEPWIEIVTGHHGIPPKKSGIRLKEKFELEDEQAACHFIWDAIELLNINFDKIDPSDKDYKNRLKSVSWQLAGITVLSDWLGSNGMCFIYHNEPKDLSDYWLHIAIPSATKAANFIPELPKVNPFQNISVLFPFIKNPTPLQQYAINEPLDKGPQLFILEDVTGAGKTEAAIVLAHRLLSEGIADGLYVGLPTMATSNAMYKRLGKVYRRFYENSALPSLVLAHGARDLSDEFINSQIIPENPSDEMNYNDSHDGDEDISASAYCNAWFADNRKKALLADVGVGTLDQALLSVLPARHQSLRMLGLNRKILLVDEVHAYDSYMQKLLDTLLEAHARQGGSTILLSATLPRKMRQNLIDAFYRGTSQDSFEVRNMSYPLAIHIPSSGEHEKHIDTRDEVKRTVSVIRLESQEDVIYQIRNAVNQGRCVCWIRNTVKAAIKTFHLLEECDWISPEHLHLFHGRFAMVDRQRIESDTLQRFGDDSDHENRKGHVLIATQVIEQSLDLDFDVLITDLAPIDLIIQRAGRLLRHIRDALGNRLRYPGAKDQRGEPCLYLFAPDPTENVNANWLKNHQEGTQAVYQHIGQLWLTAKRLLVDGNGSFSMPDHARDLIESVYSDDAEYGIPEQLKSDSFVAVGKDQCKKSMASLNVLKLNKGYTRSSGDWDEEVRIPTRLNEQETVSVALARVEQGQLQPYAHTSHHPWAMSVVKIPEKDWNNAKKHIDAPMGKMIEDLKTNIKSLRWLDIFPLTEKTKHLYNADFGWQTETGENK
jgi:CRISPR-associated endonuclease/helicase Cas3